MSAFYEHESWNATSNSFGISPDFISKYFFAGIELKEMNIKSTNLEYFNYKYTDAFSCSIHIGSKQSITKKLKLVEQVGACYSSMNITPSLPGGFLPGIGGPYDDCPYTQSFVYAYFRLGVSYCLVLK